MSVLSSLVAAYDRLEKRGEVPPFGFSSEKIGFLIPLHEDGTLAGAPVDLRDGEGKKRQARMLRVPQPVKRTSGPATNTFWDKTSYVLGVTAAEGKGSSKEHSCFRNHHLAVLADTDDPGLLALRRFVETWRPEDFTRLGWAEEMKDQNVVFALEDERLAGVCIHDRPAAKALWAKLAGEGEKKETVCLVTGEAGPIARLHPAIKGVAGAQSSGASLVSFNLDAFTSYGHEQGENAPVSETAAFAYASVLNHFLAGDSHRSIRIGDTSIVFWAEAADDAAADDAANVFAALMGLDDFDDTIPTQKIAAVLEAIRDGRPLVEVRPDLERGVRFHVLGLAPNAARLSVRYVFDDDFGVLAENFRSYSNDLRLAGRHVADRPITLRRLVLRTAPAREDHTGRLTFDRDRISPLLSGEILRSAMTGARFPASLLPLLISRIRADAHLDGIRVALLKAAIVRTMRLDGRLPGPFDGYSKEDHLVASQPSDPDVARRLGRLFALVEKVQAAALGEEINSTVKDKFLSAAAATPARTFPALIDGMQAHVKRLRNGHSDAQWITDAEMARRVGASLERRVGTLWAEIGAEVPRQLSAEEQGLFFVGYYQERYTRRDESAAGDAPHTNEKEEPAEETRS
jgi:CRISPR-associated protein Csd1